MLNSSCLGLKHMTAIFMVETQKPTRACSLLSQLRTWSCSLLRLEDEGAAASTLSDWGSAMTASSSSSSSELLSAPAGSRRRRFFVTTAM